MKGLTIFEMLLVLVIASGILMLSLNQYQSFRSVSDAEKLKQTVLNIARGAAGFYYANCKPTSTNNFFWKNTPIDSGDYYLDIKSGLRDAGFLPDQMPNPLVNQSGSDAYEGYTLRFDPALKDRTVCLQGSSGTCSETTSTGTIVNWGIIIYVCLKNANQAEYLKNMTNATNVVGCVGGGEGKSLLFWFLPSEIMGQFNSNWTQFPLMQQFTQMYTTMPMTYLTSTSGAANVQYYYCGS